jgi:hypothetical protein
MGNPAGVRRNCQALEQRRLRAARWLKRGVYQSELARRVAQAGLFANDQWDPELH